MSTSLEELQRAFQEFLLGGDATAIRARVTGTERVPADTRLGIYAHAYSARLLEVLADNFPAVHTLLGDEAFAALARAYLDAHPSEFRSIRWFGNRLPAFVGTTGPWKEHPVVAELARFEWLLRDAFDATDAVVIGEAELAALAPEAWPGLRLEFHPSLRRLDLHWSVTAFWQAVENDEDPVAPERAEHPVGWLIWRRDLTQYFRSLEVSEAWALDRAREGANFSDICEGLCEWVDAANVAGYAAGALKRWLADGLLTGLETGD
ncbi:MAG: putative DNA-binding domain-containing protein [Gammaproteobacteria bacterium]|nr:putative DNA-binding domain-containing protein [Gammaproteobacteria bacterium]